MSASAYAFVTRWTVPAPLELVWRELTRPEDWPSWWRGVERVDLVRAGDASGLGAIRRYTWRSRLPYRLSFTMETTRIEPQTLIEGRASGELDGLGIWRLTATGGGTDIRYDWQVEATKPWMRIAGPIARPLFAWNHDVVMEWGRLGLLKRVGGL